MIRSLSCLFTLSTMSMWIACVFVAVVSPVVVVVVCLSQHVSMVASMERAMLGLKCRPVVSVVRRFCVSILSFVLSFLPMICVSCSASLFSDALMSWVVWLLFGIGTVFALVAPMVPGKPGMVLRRWLKWLPSCHSFRLQHVGGLSVVMVEHARL